MRQRLRSALFTFFFPGRKPGSGQPDKEWPYIAIPDSREFISICTQDGCAVFYISHWASGRAGQSAVRAQWDISQDLRDMADTLYEAADLFDEKLKGA